MNDGFFSSRELNQTISQPKLIARCGECGLHRTCISPRMPVSGEGKKSVLIVAEAPGEREDRENTQLVGRSGQYLRDVLEDLDCDLDDDCWKTNAIICRPQENETPTNKQIDCCRPNITKLINELQPNVIIPLGSVAIKSLMIPIWQEAVGAITRWAGWIIPNHFPNAWICPNYHPSYLIRNDDPVLDLWFERYLEKAIKLTSKPWKKDPPDYQKKVECIKEPRRAARILRGMMERGGPFAFDYETEGLKPDNKNLSIVSCAVCWRGKRTIAYPWQGEAVKASRELLAGFEFKMAHNLKFEERWTRREFGHGVTNWWWDSMLAAHTLNNTTGITSLKFQSLVRLGQPRYDAHISPYLESESSNKPNRIGELDIEDVLLYNGMDAILTYKLAELQQKDVGVL